VDEGRLLECELDRRLSCWAAEVRGSADHLLVVSMLEQGDMLEVTGFLLDVRAAREKSENEIFEKTPVARASVNEDSDDELVGYFRRLLGPIATPPPSGSISIDVDTPDLSLALDGTTLGIARAGNTVLRGVAPGTHTVALSDPKRAQLHARTIEVRAGETASTRFDLETPPDLLRVITLWSGVAVAVAGVAVTAAAVAVRPDGEMVLPCAGVGCTPMSERSFHESGGVLLAPLGYSLIGAGGIAALGSWLMPAGDLWVYLSIAAGIVVGATSYAISAAF
jgi:hypothetical protein